MKHRSTNFHWFEYLEKVAEELRFLEYELEHKKSLLSWLESEERCFVETRDLSKRVNLLLKHCEDFKIGTIEKIETKAHEPIEPTKYLELQDELGYINRGTTFLSIVINQRLEGIRFLDFSSHFPHESLSCGFQKIHNAANMVLREYFRLMYGEEWLRSPIEPEPIVLFSEDIYRVFPVTRVANIPLADKHRCRFWVGIGHETFHGKMRQLFKHLSKGAQADPEGLTKLQRISKGITVKECKDISKTIEDLEEDISKIHGYPKDYPGALRYHMESQIREFFCDFASLMLTGPAVLSMLASSWADKYKNLPHGVLLYFEDLRHPPAYVRLKCMLELMKRRLGYKKNEILFWESRIDEITGFDATEESIVELYMNFSRMIIEKYSNKMLKILDLLIFEKEYYTRKRWKQVTDLYQHLITEGDIPIDTKCVDLLNLAWLKREDSFNVVKVYNDINVFKAWHRRERKLFESVVLHLNEHYREINGG